MGLKEDALNYHSRGRKGKIETGITKECKNQKDITLAYSPGVAEPCKEIARDPSLVYEYTAKGNLVAVVTNGTAVLGLGAIGPLAGKPVMEGKAVLFKVFADIDCYDIELNAKTPEEIISACRMLEPTFGGINLEDIKAPECFEVEEKLREELDIPVFHDDQHGTAIVSAAALLNACEITKRKISEIKCVLNGAGAAAIACAQMYLNIGVKRENLILCDSKGVVYKGRIEGMNKYKERFENDTKKRTLAEALENADFFCGLSVAGAVTKEMVKSMAKNPIIFAMANPDPEITPKDIMEVRNDAIIATGRSDYPNQVNNVLGYPYIFRGALDVLSRRINEEMKMAAVQAIAALAKEDIPESVTKSYDANLSGFGREYLIPKPFDPRLLLRVAPAVAKAAMETNVARKKIDIEQYVDHLESRLGVLQSVTRKIKRNVIVANRSSGKKIRVVLPEGTSPKILKAAEIVRSEGICEPILIGSIPKINELIKENKLEKQLSGIHIIDPTEDKRSDKYSSLLLEKRARKGLTRMGAYELITGDHHYFASMMVNLGEAEAFCSGVHHNYGDTLRPALHVIGTQPDKVLAGIYMLLWKEKSIFIADTTVNIQSNAEQLAQIAIQTHDIAKIYLKEQPRVAMLSFSNFGSAKHPESEKVCKATGIVKKLRPDIEIDGEMQADFALSSELLERSYGFSTLKGPANVLIFPDLTSGNIAYKILGKLGGATTIGPILTGMKKPVNVLARNSDIDEIVNLITFTVHHVQNGV
ncbi:NADP-dependent malic enzyme [Silvanigrella aquatica]|uniref:NADP-dependent malic enzyme n=2 Tax=Silvanigrella aquatica TaxID=1915309 RepID=A0A1L4D4D1_9BACT|nr:NADP-dependent malic enzyme [Silvanigrella aquatica]